MATTMAARFPAHCAFHLLPGEPALFLPKAHPTTCADLLQGLLKNSAPASFFYFSYIINFLFSNGSVLETNMLLFLSSEKILLFTSLLPPATTPFFCASVGQTQELSVSCISIPFPLTFS